MSEKELWINMLTAPRGEVEKVFVSEREKIFAQIVQLDTEISSANENRFADNPIDIELRFDRKLSILKAMPDKEQTPIRNHAFDLSQIARGVEPEG